jgi:hypothetical protein
MGHPQRGRVAVLGLFTHLGLADSALHPKIALTAWDSVRQRPYRPQ